MKLFKKIRPIELGNKAASGIVQTILTVQDKVTAFFGRRTRTWSRRRQFIFLYGVCLVFGGMSIVASLAPFRRGSTSSPFIPKAIAVPVVIPEHPGFRITVEEFQKVEDFKRSHPDLRNSRPALLDSLNFIEKMYNEQR